MISAYDICTKALTLQNFCLDYSSYCAGVDWDADDTQREEWEENLHWWIEECDTLQGFHVYADTDTAFGAVASKVCSQIRDDFPRTPLGNPAHKSMSEYICAAKSLSTEFSEFPPSCGGCSAAQARS
jgi:hypothetical protein